MLSRMETPSGFSTRPALWKEFGVRNLYLRGNVWRVKKMVRGILICRSLETSDQGEASRKKDRMIAIELERKKNFPGKARS